MDPGPEECQDDRHLGFSYSNFHTIGQVLDGDLLDFLFREPADRNWSRNDMKMYRYGVYLPPFGSPGRYQPASCDR